MAGDNQFSVADITTITFINSGHALEMSIPMSAPHVKRWYDPELQKLGKCGQEQADAHAGWESASDRCIAKVS